MKSTFDVKLMISAGKHIGIFACKSMELTGFLMHCGVFEYMCTYFAWRLLADCIIKFYAITER